MRFRIQGKTFIKSFICVSIALGKRFKQISSANNEGGIKIFNISDRSRWPSVSGAADESQGPEGRRWVPPPTPVLSLASPVYSAAFHVGGEVGDKGSRGLQRLRVTFSAQYLQRAGRLL